MSDIAQPILDEVAADFQYESCPVCNERYETIKDLHGAKLGVGEVAVHRGCWHAYVEITLTRAQELGERIWHGMHAEPHGRYHMDFGREDMELIRFFVRPARNR